MPTKKVSTAAGKTKSPRTAAKKVATKSGAAPMPCAFGEQCFWVHNGPVLSNLIELRDILQDINDEVYGHHVNGSKNDFADWVEYVLTEQHLAKALRKAKNRKDAHTVVVKCLKTYGI